MDAQAERGIWEKYAARIRAYGLCYLRDRAAAEDLVQHVLLTVLRALREGRVEELGRLEHYVLGTCRNSVMELRRGVLLACMHGAAYRGDGPALLRELAGVLAR